MSRILQAIRKVQSRASSIAFLLSTGITVCGSSLEFLIGTCMVWELKVAKLVPLLLDCVLIVLLLTLLLGIVTYATNSTFRKISDDEYRSDASSGVCSPWVGAQVPKSFFEIFAGRRRASARAVCAAVESFPFGRLPACLLLNSTCLELQ